MNLNMALEDMQEKATSIQQLAINESTGDFDVFSHGPVLEDQDVVEIEKTMTSSLRASLRSSWACHTLSNFQYQLPVGIVPNQRLQLFYAIAYPGQQDQCQVTLPLHREESRSIPPSFEEPSVSLRVTPDGDESQGLCSGQPTINHCWYQEELTELGSVKDNTMHVQPNNALGIDELLSYLGLDLDREDLSLRDSLKDTMATAYLTSDGEPESITEAKSLPDGELWMEATMAELARLKKMGGFEVKTRDWVPVLRKARIVAKGFSQWYGVDYSDTFAAMVHPSTISLVLALAAMNN
eukprot:1516904-Rhodomonas_salina.1